VKLGPPGALGALVALVALLAACTVDGTLPSGTRCDDGTCAAPFVCTGGLCVRPDDGADAGPDDDPATGCGKVRQLADRFDGPALSPYWSAEVETGGSVQVTSGALLLLVPATLDAAPSAAVFSRFAYDLRESSVSVAVPLVAVDEVTTSALEVSGPGGEELALLYHRGGLLNAAMVTAAGESTSSVDYDAALHRVWRLAERSGRLLFQTGPAATGPWTTLSEVAAPPWISTARVGLRHFGIEPSPEPRAAQFDDLNGGQPRGEACPATELSDTFDNAVARPLWFASAPSPWCRVQEANGEVVLTAKTGAAPEGGDPYCSYQTQKQYELDGSSVTVSINELIDSSFDGYANILLLQDVLGTGAGFYTDGGRIYCQVGEADACDLLYAPAEHRHFRVSLAGGEMRWEVSADGAAFTTVVARPSPYTDTRVTVTFGVSVETLPATAGSSLRVGAVNASD
jgi:hypothetical protein